MMGITHLLPLFSLLQRNKYKHNKNIRLSTIVKLHIYHDQTCESAKKEDAFNTRLVIMYGKMSCLSKKKSFSNWM